MATLLEKEVESKPLVLRKKRPSPKKWLWPAVFVLILIGAYAGWRYKTAGKGTTGLITTTASRGDLIETVSATGSVESQTGASVKIGSQITGVIKRLYADVGTHVKKGQLIAQLDLPDLQATYEGSVAALQAAQTKYQQQQSGVHEERVQTSTAIDQARATLASDQQKLLAAQEAASEQKTATPSDIKRAQTAISSAQAALATANAAQVQTQAGANLQVQTAQEQLDQAQATAVNSSANLQRTQILYQQGYIASSSLDQAKATDSVNQSLVRSAQKNVDLVQQKITADLETAKDAVAQAQQNVVSAQAALAAANAETYTTAQRIANVKDAQDSVTLAQAALQAAIGNNANDLLKDQDVKQAQEAVSQAAQTANFNEDQVAKSYIRSPISGTVLQLAAQQGETLAAGLSAPTVISVADLSRQEIDAFVDETDIGKVKLGQIATCTVDAFANQNFVGRVKKIASGSTIQQNVVTYDVTIGISDPHRQLRPDMTATISIQIGKKTNVILVPSVAVQIGTHGSTINVLQGPANQPDMVPVPVVTGGTDGVNTEIVKGLTEGQTIVLAGGTSSSRRGPASPFGPKNSSGGGGRGG